MFERFTSQARRILVVAGELTRERGETPIEPGHLLAAVLDESVAAADPVIAAIVGTGDTSVEELRERALAALGDAHGRSVRRGESAFSADAKKVLELSLREALTQGHNYIGAFHVLLALIYRANSNPDEASSAAISGAGLSLEPARAAAGRAAPVGEEFRGGRRVPVKGGRRRRDRRFDGGTLERVIRATEPTGGFDAIVRRAARTAGDGHVSSADLLLAMTQEPDTYARAVLAQLGIERAAVEEAVRAVLATGEPDTGATRMVSINPNTGVIEIKDPVVAQLLRDEMAAGTDDLMRAISELAMRFGKDVRDRAEGYEDEDPQIEARGDDD